MRALLMLAVAAALLTPGATALTPPDPLAIVPDEPMPAASDPAPALEALTAAALVPSPPSASTAAGCPTTTVSTGTSPEHIVTTHADCTVDIELNRGIICVGPWGTTDHHQVGPVSVTNHRCTFPGGDPIDSIVIDPGPLASSEAGLAAPCGQTHVDGLVSVALRSDCSVLVSIRVVECVWGGYWHHYTPPPVVVREYRCGPPEATS